jgi:chitin-binding protein
MKERGSAMLTAVVATMVLLLISGIISAVVIYQFKLEKTEDNGFKAYYSAEAGISYGIVEVRNHPDTYFQAPYSEESTQLADMPLHNPFGPAYGGGFDVYVQTYDDVNSYIFTVTSTGYYPDLNGVKRKLEQQYAFPR